MSEPTATYLEDEYVFVWSDLDVQLTIERFREERGELKADAEPKSASGEGILPSEKLNLSSARSLRIYANTLGGYGMLEADAWFGLLTQACDRAKRRYREGAPSVRLVDVEWRDRPRYLVEPFIEAGSRSILFGDGGVSKSMHALALAVSVATGQAIIPGTSVLKTGPVLYLDWEDEAETHAERMAAICGGAGLEAPDNVVYMRRTGSLHESTREVRRQIAQLGAVLVIVDSVGAACGGDPERAADIIKTFDAMRALEVPVQAIHHVPKDAKDKTKPFGSVYAGNLARLMWRLDREPGATGEIFIRASHQKGNNVGALPSTGHRVLFETDDLHQLTAVRFAPATLASLPSAPNSGNAVRNRIGALLTEYGSLEVKAIADSLEVGEHSVRTILNRHKDWFVHLTDGRWGLLDSEHVEPRNTVAQQAATEIARNATVGVTTIVTPVAAPREEEEPDGEATPLDNPF